jgi:hypothetical protein
MLNTGANKEPNIFGPHYFTLFILLLTFASNQWSRQAIFYLCDFSSSGDAFRHINVALEFSKAEYASLASIVFTLTFATVSLFAGTVTDKYPRNVVTGFA